MLRYIAFVTSLLIHATYGCNFYPVGEYLRFVRIPENLRVGHEVLQVEVHPRKNLSVQPVDKEEDAHLFTYRDVNRTHVAVVLAQSLEHLVDSDNPQNVVKFRLGCDFDTGDDLISAYLSVTVYIEDVNDHPPIFLHTPYTVTVDELTPTGLTIFRGINAFDRDKPNTPNSDVQYSITAGDERGHFTLDIMQRALVLKKPLDYDKGDKEFSIVITASDRGTPQRSTNTTIYVRVQDNDDLPPKFTRDVYKTQIAEFYPVLGKKIHKELVFEEAIKAADGDVGVAAAVRYDLVSGNDRMMFSLDSINGSLFLEKEVDLEREHGLPGNTFILQIQAAQIDNPLKTAQARLEIQIIDLNDNLPEFEVDFYNISIVENLPNGFSVLQVMATDRDQGDNGEFVYQLRDAHEAFTIDARSGWLTVRNQTVLDRERHESLRMKVYAKEKNPSVVGHHLDKQRLSKWRRTPVTQRRTDKERTTYIFPDKMANRADNIEYFEDTQQLMAFVTVEVTLLDANDNNPQFVPSNLYEFSIYADAPAGARVGQVKALDPDLGRNGIVLYDLQRTSNLTMTSPFQVDAKTGLITLTESPILEGRHALFIEASDQPANPSERRYSLAVVTVEVLSHDKDTKAERPEFLGAPYEFWVGSNVGVGASVGQVKVNDAMEKNDVIYDLLHGYEDGVPFAVEERSGVITVIDELSRYSRPLYEFEAMASQEHSNVTLATNATVHVVDVHDQRGVLLKSTNSPMIFHVKENIAGATIGRLFHVNISTLPLNSAGSIRFLIANQQDVTDDIAIGEDGTIYAQKPLDREKRDIYRLTVIAEFSKGVISGAGIYQITVHVDDDNDNPPLFELSSYEGVILENSKRGTEVNISHVGTIKATDADAGQNAVFVYTLFGEGHESFSIDVNTGTVRFVGTRLDREEKSTYLLKVVARDKGNLSSDTKLTISVLDVNDHVPKFSHIVIPLGEDVELIENDDSSRVSIYEERRSNVSGMVSRVGVLPKTKFAAVFDSIGPLFSVAENVAIGSTILKLDAIDMDSGVNGQIKFEFISEVFMPPVVATPDAINAKRFFVVNERHGHVIVARALPPEAEFRLNISALDGDGFSDNISIRFFIKDVNDHFPMFRKSWYSFSVEEAQYTRRTLGRVDATDLDFGLNANITYSIQSDGQGSPFNITPLTGVLSVNGELDREKTDKYSFTVLARDNGIDKKLTSSVIVEVQVLDVNDNAPTFFAYDELLERTRADYQKMPNHNFESADMVPVYHARLAENSPVGSTVARVYANDSDFIGNGNGLILFSIPQRKNRLNLFAIDSKEGIISTVGKLDYESQAVHNVTVIASDLGSPSLSSTAMLMLRITDIPDEDEMADKPVFISRYYELEVDENVNTPLELLTLNLTEYYESFKMKYFLLNENSAEVKKTFVIDPRNGTLYLVRSPDRELVDRYELIIRAQRQKVSRQLPHIIYPVSDDALEGMSKFDVKVVVVIRDVNDNAPRFRSSGRPMVTALPTTAGFGYQLIQLQATDADCGINADIRYQIINDQSQRFAIDSITGQVRAVAAFHKDAGRVFGFDVKATDKRGADDGKSAIANVFVYALEESQQLVLVVGGRPLAVEARISNMTDTLSALSGYDVRMRALRPNSRSMTDATDVFLYAIDAMSNAIVHPDALQRSLSLHESQLRATLSSWRVLEVGGRPLSAAQLGSLSTAQLSALATAAIVLLGAGVAAIAVLCCRSSRNGHKAYSRRHFNAFATDHLSKYGGLFPSSASYNQCQEINYSDGESYVDVKKQHTAEEFGKAHQKCIKTQYDSSHDSSCVKFNQRAPNNKSADSGIDRCACIATPHASEESSGCSYEDSLKSTLPQVEIRTKTYHKEEPSRFSRRASFGHQHQLTNSEKRHNHGRQSFSENIYKRAHFERIGSAGRMVRQISTPNMMPYYLNKKSVRKEEPVVDYDQSDVDEMYDRFGRTPLPPLPPPPLRRPSNIMEVAGQSAVFVATPTAAEIIRRQANDRIMFARPLH